MKKLLILFTLCTLILTHSKADEGMWVLPSLNQYNFEQMKEMGFLLNDSDIYSIDKKSIKDAVVIFGNGCTGEVISEKGLILTNHHCGYDAIQSLSTIKDNYLANGFWAKSYSEEIPAPGLTVTFLKSMEDITDSVLFNISDTLSVAERIEAINIRVDQLKKDASKGNSYRIDIKPFFNGNMYYKMVYEVYKDVRMVGTPPSAIGKFGFDTDNWMWPRHTGDFSMFRVYADKDGNPADYSTYNSPLSTPKHLPISIKGVEKGDFAMTIGFPGSTERYMPSWGIKQEIEIVNKARISIRGIKQDIWMADMQADPKIDLQYASKYARSSNYWKNSIGMNRGVEKLNVIEKKREFENKLDIWIHEDSARTQKYGTILQELEQDYAAYEVYLKSRIITSECLINGIEIFKQANSIEKIIEKLQQNSQADVTNMVASVKEKLTKFYKDYSPSTDKKVMVSLLQTYISQMESVGSLPPNLIELRGKNAKQFEKYTNKIFSKSLFANESKIMNFLQNSNNNLLDLAKDPAYIESKQIYDYYKEMGTKSSPSYYNIDKNLRLFTAAMMEMSPDKTFYPDANSTMRLSYGVVGDYQPKDGVIYKHFTTLEGIIEKEIPNSYEFSVPQKLKDLYQSKNFGDYSAPDGKVHVCFTSNNDITGGNSGSPVLNKNGELFGLAFDGNWEAMSGDIAFEPELQKTISVDIRYVLFIIEKYAGATNLIEEMTIIK
ncbi:MAG: S46 family peptidase [Breznakibacter sp.]|nr:S46 family peptidase [Breznakibacter sp.]